MNHPFVLCGFCRPCVFHFCLDEKLQDVGVLLVLVLLSDAAVSGIPAGCLWTQHQVTVVEATLRGFIHDVEPWPRLHHTTDVVLPLVLLLQVLDKSKKKACASQQL